MDSIAPSFSSWKVQRYQIGQYLAIGTPDISSGVHVMNDGAPEDASRALLRALELVSI